jgi:hypothetical protein
VHWGVCFWLKSYILLISLCFKKLIGFIIKNLELYIEQDSFNKLKGVVYGMGSSSRSSVVRVVSAIVKKITKII